MRVLFLMIAYPDVRYDTNMYTDLAEEFAMNGHDVYVAAPHCNKTQVDIEGRVKVLRIKTMVLFKTSLIRKGIANILLPFQYENAINKHLQDIVFDLVISPTPPITFIKTAKYLKKKYHSMIYLILRDIFPQNARDLGLIKNPLIFLYFRRKEKALYKISDAIGCMSEKNILYVHAHNKEVELSKLHLLQNWGNTYPEDTLPFTRTPELYGKFIAIFGGNFGIPQRIDFIVDVADRIKKRKDILFILIGNGTEKERIRNIVSERKLANIMILDELPRTEYLNLLKQCDIGLVNLSEKFTIPNIPSRTLSYWALKLPVLAAIDRNTDYGELLDKSGGGVWSNTGDFENYINNLLMLVDNPEKRKQMGIRGYDYFKRELNTEKAYKTILSNFGSNK